MNSREEYVKGNTVQAAVLSAVAIGSLLGFEYYNDSFTIFKALMFFVVWVTLNVFVDKKVRFVKLDPKVNSAKYRAEIDGGFKTISFWVGSLSLFTMVSILIKVLVFS